MSHNHLDLLADINKQQEFLQESSLSKAVELCESLDLKFSSLEKLIFFTEEIYILKKNKDGSLLTENNNPVKEAFEDFAEQP